MRKNIWLDGMMGVVVGDALGCPVQFLSRDRIKNRPQGAVVGMEAGGAYNMPEGTWTDDSSMAIATMAGIIEKGEADPDDIMARFVKWELKGAYTPFGEAFDQGGTCTSAIYNYIEKRDINTCGSTGEYANGNGALMRIMPVCLYYYDRQKKVCTSEDEAIHGIHMISGLTHNHLRSQMCCGIYYFCVKSILDGVEKGNASSLISLLQEGIDRGLKYYGQDIRNLTEMAYLGRLFHLAEFKDLSEDKIRSTGYVIDTIEAAVWCLINTNTFEECLLKAVNLGDDADTVGAVAGGLAGLYYGYDAIPAEWIKVIKKREWIEGLCEKFADLRDIEAKVVDIHSHMLPAVDDGATSYEVTKQMIRLAYEEGCRHLFLTPHAAYIEEEEAKIPEKMAAIRKWIEAEEMDLKIYSGTEIYVDPEDDEDIENLVNNIKGGIFPTLNGTQYVLIEFYLGGFELDEVVPAVLAIIEAGYTPVIAHAERYGSSFDDLCYLKSLGCLFQMNICDLYRDVENDINQMTHILIHEKMFDFVGTDAHGINRRPPVMKEYIDFMYRNYDKDYIDSILYRNAIRYLGIEQA